MRRSFTAPCAACPESRTARTRRRPRPATARRSPAARPDRGPPLLAGTVVIELAGRPRRHLLENLPPSDPHDLGQVERQFDERVAEAIVLRRVGLDLRCPATPWAFDGEQAEGVERLTVFVDRRGMDEQHSGVVVSPESFTRIPYILSTVVLLFPWPSCSFHGRLALSTAGSGRSPGHRHGSAGCNGSRFEPGRTRPACRRRGAERLSAPTAATTAGRDRRERTGRRGRGRRRG